MGRAVVIGAGVAGMGVALTLGRRGHDVTLLERDEGLTAGGPVPAERRRGTPQARHSHAFLARLHNLLRDDEPDVLAALLEAGATELRFLDNPPPTLTDRDPRPGDEDLIALACRRTTYEDVFRRAVLAEPTIRFLDGHAVTGLLGDAADTSTRPQPRVVTGVATRTTAGATGEIRADAVIDAGGRRSRLPEWLDALGTPLPPDHTQDCGIVYLTRFYRLLDRADTPTVDGPIGGDLGYFKYAIFVGDNRTFSVTAGVPTEDEELRKLLHGDAFDLTLRMMPATADWVDPSRATPLDDVAMMAGLRNQRRRLVLDGVPIALGVHAIGDAAVCTNPLYGRGCSLGMVHARLCADILEREGWATSEAAVELDAATEAELGPWYRASVDADRADISSRVDGVPAGGFQELLREGFMPAARTDPDVFRVFLRSFNLLDHPAAMLQRPDLLAKINEAYAQRHDRETPPPPGPPRAELVAALTASNRAT